MTAQPRTIVIVGGVAAGMSAATRLRRNDEFAHIIVFERGENVSFANCGLPYHIAGVIPDRADLLLQTPQSLHQRFNLDVRVRHEMLAINPDEHSIDVIDHTSGRRFTQRYDALVIATGATPIRPPLPGIERAYTLRSVADLDQIMAALSTPIPDAATPSDHLGPPTAGYPQNNRPRTAAVLGGGFIGLELAENLSRRGLAVTIVELADQVLPPLDPEMAGPVVDELHRHGVAIHLATTPTRIGPDAVDLDDGTSIPADIVIAAVGVRPDSAGAAEAGIATGLRDGIVVDALHLTAAPDVYAVGDVALKDDAIDGEPAFVALAQTANRYGRGVADVICGRHTERGSVLGTAIVRVFNLTAATTGWNEKRLRAAGRPVRVIHTHPASHAGYYPGAEPMSLKLLLDPVTDAILGAQAVGGDGVDKRIDVIATAMFAGLRGSQLADLELAYAPQFGSAKDPVNMLGYIADNHASGAIASIQWHELSSALTDGLALADGLAPASGSALADGPEAPTGQPGANAAEPASHGPAHLLDVRTTAEHAAGAIPGSINIPLDELRARIGEIPPGPIVVYCQVGHRGNTATRILTHRGRLAVNLDGGYRTWAASPAARVDISMAT